MRQAFDASALEPEAGVRAIFLLYKRGQWGRLEDFGMVRGEAEPALQEFEGSNLIGERLTKAQTRKLEQSVPGLKEASIEMRLAYALKFIDQGVKLDGEYTRVIKEIGSQVKEVKEVNNG